MRITVAEALQADSRQPFFTQLARLGFIGFAILQAGDDILQRTAPRHQRFSLEHVTGAAVDAEQRFAKHLDAAGRRLQQTGADIQQGRFTAAGRPDHGNEFTRRNRQIGVSDCGVTLGAIVFGDEGATDVVEMESWNHGSGDWLVTAGWQGGQVFFAHPTRIICTWRWPSLQTHWCKFATGRYSCQPDQDRMLLMYAARLSGRRQESCRPVIAPHAPS